MLDLRISDLDLLYESRELSRRRRALAPSNSSSPFIYAHLCYIMLILSYDLHLKSPQLLQAFCERACAITSVIPFSFISDVTYLYDDFNKKRKNFVGVSSREEDIVNFKRCDFFSVYYFLNDLSRDQPSSFADEFPANASTFV